MTPLHEGDPPVPNQWKEEWNMKKTSILILTILLAALCANSYAEDLSGQITSLEQRADRIQAQINLASSRPMRRSTSRSRLSPVQSIAS